MNCDAYLANAIRMFSQASNKPDECVGRAIIHAAYYSVFHLVADRLRMDVLGTNLAKHSDIARRLDFYVGPGKALNEARRHFRTLRHARVDADYRLATMMTVDKVSQAICRASDIFEAAGIKPSVA